MSSRELAIEKNKPSLNIYIVCCSRVIFHSHLFNMKRFIEVSRLLLIIYLSFIIYGREHNFFCILIKIGVLVQLISYYLRRGSAYQSNLQIYPHLFCS